MDQWNKTKPGYKTKAVQHGSITVIIHRPELTPEQAARREKEVLRTLASMKGGRVV